MDRFAWVLFIALGFGAAGWGLLFGSLAFPQAWQSSLVSAGWTLIMLKLLAITLFAALAGGAAVFAGLRWMAARRRSTGDHT